MFALALLVAGTASAQLTPALDVALGYAGPLIYVQAACTVEHCGTATARGPALSAGARLFFGSELKLGAALRGTVMTGDDALGGGATLQAAARYGTDLFIELDVGAGYGWARRPGDWFSDSIGPAAALEAGFRASSGFSLFARGETIFAEPGILGLSFGLEWHPNFLSP